MTHRYRTGWPLVVGLAVLMGGAALVRSAGPDDAAAQQRAWDRLKSMVGVWKGEDDTQSPPSSIEREFEMIVQDKFVLIRTKSVSPKETHEDWEILSFDKVHKKVMLRQFGSEGFVNRFVLDQVSPDGDTLTFVSQDCENAPPGFRVRAEYTIAGDKDLSQRLDLAPPGAEFSPCAGGRLRRQ